MEPDLTYTLEECDAGGWKARFSGFEPVAARIRETVELDVDTDHMLLWHQDGVKISFVKSSGVMMIRTDDRGQAEDLVASMVQEER